MSVRTSLFILFFWLLTCSAVGRAQNSPSLDAAHLCNRVQEIKELPIKKDRGVDTTYDLLIEAGEAVVPCLIDRISDTTLMRDPRCPLFSDKTTVGDVAYFVLVDILKIGFVELLPDDVQERFKTDGAYVYHDYIERNGNRKQLQAKLCEWYRLKRNLH